MGDRDSQRLSNSLCRPPGTGMQAKCSYILLRATPSDSRRGESFVAKGCSPSLQSSTSREFLLNSLSGAQERRSNEPCDKLEKAKRVGNTLALQNGGHEYPKRTVEDKRLDGKDRPQGCILHHPDASHSPTFSKVYGKLTALPVYMPPIQPVLCSMGLTKVIKPISIFLRSMGVRMIVYIDDILVMGESPEQVKGHLEALTYLLTGLGFVINTPKSITTPAQRIEYLGLLVDSTTLHLSLPGEKLYHIRSEIDQITKKSSPITARELAQIIGKLHAASQAALPAPLFCRFLQGDLQIALNSSSQNYNSLLTLSQPAQEELAWWQDKLSHCNGKALLHRTETVTIRSDASLQGWGAVCDGTRTGGPWSHAEQEMHINCLELLAATLAVKAFLKDQRGVSVKLQLDNQTAVA